MPLGSVPNDRLRHMRIGDARVSKADGSQSLELQRDALSRKSRELVRRVPLARAALCLA